MLQFSLFFLLIAAVNIFVCITIFRSLSECKREKFKDNQNKNSKNININIIFLVLGITFSFSVFSQFETTFILTLPNVFNDAEKIFSILLLCNSVMGILLQFSLIRLSISSKLLFIIGNIFFAISYVVFLLSNQLYLFLFGVLLFTIGENMTIPTADILLANYQGKDFNIFKLGELKYLGSSIVPTLLGYILANYGNFFYTISLCVGCILAIFFICMRRN